MPYLKSGSAAPGSPGGPSITRSARTQDLKTKKIILQCDRFYDVATSCLSLQFPGRLHRPERGCGRATSILLKAIHTNIRQRDESDARVPGNSRNLRTMGAVRVFGKTHMSHIQRILAVRRSTELPNFWLFLNLRKFIVGPHFHKATYNAQYIANWTWWPNLLGVATFSGILNCIPKATAMCISKYCNWRAIAKCALSAPSTFKISRFI